MHIVLFAKILLEWKNCTKILDKKEYLILKVTEK